MKNIAKIMMFVFISVCLTMSCSGKEDAKTKQGNSSLKNDGAPRFSPPDMGDFKFPSSGVESIVIDDQVKFLSEDCVENYSPVEVVNIVFDGKTATANGKTATESGTKIYEDSDGKKLTVYLQQDVSGDDAEAQGVIIEYKGNQVLKYVLSGNFTGTVKIKNKSADCIVELNEVKITSSVTGPAMHLTSEKFRTFVIVKEGTDNLLNDSRVLNQSEKMLNDKKGSFYAKGAVIFSGSESKSEGGRLVVENTGYKHAIYSHDYIRIKNIDLSVLCNGETSRDCIRTLNAVIIDSGNINLVSNGVLYDDEGCAIKVEGEDADEDKLSVEYTAGAGFIVINGGSITSVTTSKGMTAHWKSAETAIGKEGYKEIKNTSLLYGTGVLNSSAVKPEPYLIINDGTINITTTLTPYENEDASCSPEGIEAKYDLIINGGNISVNTTDDSLNAGGAIKINGGTIYAVSSMNDAIDSNGPDGITINGGSVYAKGTNVPECAFDCDNNPFTVNGGNIIGFGTGNYSSPSSESAQYVIVLGASDYAGKTLSIKQGGDFVFTCDVPLDAGEVIILSSDSIKKGKYEIYADGKKQTNGKIIETVTKINVTSGFGVGGPGGPGGFPGGGPDNGFPGEFDGKNFPEPPEGFEKGGNFERREPPARPDKKN